VALVCELWGYFPGVDCDKSFGWVDLLFLGVAYMIVGMCCRVVYMQLCMLRYKIGVMRF
jgi:hypothetical protein